MPESPWSWSSFFYDAAKYFWDFGSNVLTAITGNRFPNIPKLSGNPFLGRLTYMLDKKGIGVQNTLKELHEKILQETNPERRAYYWLGPQTVVATSNPDDIATITHDLDKFSRSPLKLIEYSLGLNLFNATGKARKQRMPVYARHFANPKQLKKYLETINAIAQDRIEDAIKNHEDLEDFCAEYGLQAMLATVLGVENNSEILNRMTLKIREILKEIMSEVMSFPNVIKWMVPKLPRQMFYRNQNNNIGDFQRKITDAIAKELADQIKNAKPESFLAQLKDATKEEDINKTADEISAKIAGEISALLFAGFDSTASTLHWLLRHLADHPNIQEQIIQEVVNLFPNNDSLFNEEQITSLFSKKTDVLEKLPTLNAVIKEILRLFPPFIFLTRGVEVATQLGDLNLKKGDMVNFLIYSAHRDPAIWGEDAEEFNPDRFKKELTPEQQKAYIPFGAGSGICVAPNFAHLELTVMLTQLFRKYRVSVTKTDEVADLFETTLEKGTPKPKNPVQLQLAEHNIKPTETVESQETNQASFLTPRPGFNYSSMEE